MACITVVTVSWGQLPACAQAINPPASSPPAAPQRPVHPGSPNALPGTPSGPVSIISASQLKSLPALNITAGSTLIIDFSKAPGGGFLNGNLTNSGTIYAVSNNPSVTTALLNTAMLANNRGGVISTVLPSRGLPGLSNLLPALNLKISASSIINAGTISSANALLVTSATSVINTGSFGAATDLSVTGAGAITNTGAISAIQNIYLNSAIGQITNGGTIASSLGNINVTSAQTQNLIFKGTGGILSAVNGDINFRDPLFSGTANLNISGGDFISRQLNLYGGNGQIDGLLNSASGALNTCSSAAHVGVTVGALNLGTINQAGDPTYFNDSGDINITGNIQVGEALAILASGNIKTAPGVTLIQARNGAGLGFDINIVAGANVTGINSTATIGTTPPITGNSTSAVIIAGPSPNGGDVDFSASPNLNINANSTCSGCSGAHVTLAAYAGNSGGHILMAPPGVGTSGTVVTVSGSGSGANGNVSMYAGAGSGNAIQSGSIVAAGGSGSGAGSGTVTIATGNPVSSDGLSMIFGQNGSIISGNNLIAAATPSPAGVLITGDVQASNKVSISAGGDILAQPNVVAQLALSFGIGASALSPDGRFLYVVNPLTNQVDVVNTSSNTLTTAISVGVVPAAVSISGDGTRVYVANNASNTVSVIDTNTNSVILTIPLASAPSGLTLSADGKQLFVTLGVANQLVVVDTVTMAQTSVPVGSQPGPVVFNATNSMVYVGNISDKTIQVYDPSSNSITATSSISIIPTTLIGCPCGTKLYVGDGFGNAFSEFSTLTNALLLPTKTANSPIDSAINPTGSTAYFAGTGPNQPVMVINTLTNASVFVNTPSPSLPQGIAAGFQGNNPMAYLSDFSSGLLYSIKTPAISAPQLGLNSTAGNIFIASGPTVVSASTGGSGNIAVTSPGRLVSAGGSAGAGYQLATTGDIVVNAPITGALIDFHAIAGSLTNNSVMTASDQLFFIASPLVTNNGTMTIANSSAATALNMQSPTGTLQLVLGAGSLISSLGSGGTGDINLNVVGGHLLSVSGPGTITAGSTVNFHGNDDERIFVAVKTVNGEVGFAPHVGSLHLETAAGDLLVCGCIDTSSASKSGGDVLLQALGNIGISGEIITDGAGTGNTAGNIMVLTPGTVGIIAGGLSASGQSGASGGTIFVSGSFLEFLGFAPPAIVATGSGASATGGTVAIVAPTVSVVGVNANGSSIDVSNPTGTAGKIAIQNQSSTVLDIGTSCGCNGFQGGLLANGVQGGRISIAASGGLKVEAGTSVTANGTTAGGAIEITSAIPSWPMVLQNDGLLEAVNTAGTSGRIGVNSGSSYSISVTGNGQMRGGEFVSFGNLDSATLQPFNPVVSLSPRASFSFGNINVAQGSDITNLILIGLVPLTPVVPLVASGSQLPNLLDVKSAAIVVANFTPLKFDSTTILPTDRNWSALPAHGHSIDTTLSVLQGAVEKNVSANLFIPGGRFSGAAGTAQLQDNVVSVTDDLPGNVQFRRGSILFTPDSGITVSTSFGTLRISAGSVVFAMLSDHSLSLYNLHDSRGVCLSVEGKQFNLPLGHQAIVAHEALSSFDSVNPTPIIGVRSVGHRNLSDAVILYAAEFSLPQALSVIEPVRVIRSAQAGADRALANSLVRDAAIRALISTSRGPYQQYKER